MAEFLRDGCTIHYELIGEGPMLVLTPGGRLGGEALRHVAEMLAGRFRVMIWDRRNTGRSSVWFGDQFEQLAWADDLAAMLRDLGLGPAYLAGGSAGARVSYLTAVRQPDLVAGLALWTVSGGPYAGQVLGYLYHTPYIDAALAGGMAAVAATPFFKERIEANPANEARLMAIAPERFVAVLRNWNASFYFDRAQPVLCASEDDLRSISCPTLIVEGNDDVHTAEASTAVHALVPHSQLIPCPWSREEWFDHVYGRSPGSPLALYPRVVPAIAEFLMGTKAFR